MKKTKIKKKFEPKPKPKALTFPPESVFFNANLEDQVRIWRNTHVWLDPEKRKAAKKTNKRIPFIGDVTKRLKVYNQHWDKLRTQCQNHPDYFTWPSTLAWGGNGKLQTAHWDKIGALGLFGYEVGQNTSLSETGRREILNQVFAAAIPPFTSWQRLSQWGDPASAKRLQKMAECLASFTRNAKRRQNANMSTAIGRWESDLKFLRKKYYQGTFKFDWPETNLNSYDI